MLGNQIGTWQNNPEKEINISVTVGGWIVGVRGTAGTVDIFPLISSHSSAENISGKLQSSSEPGSELPRRRMSAVKAIHSHPANWTAEGIFYATRESAFSGFSYRGRTNQRSTTTKGAAFLSKPVKIDAAREETTEWMRVAGFCHAEWTRKSALEPLLRSNTHKTHVFEPISRGFSSANMTSFVSECSPLFFSPSSLGICCPQILGLG